MHRSPITPAIWSWGLAPIAALALCGCLQIVGTDGFMYDDATGGAGNSGGAGGPGGSGAGGSGAGGSGADGSGAGGSGAGGSGAGGSGAGGSGAGGSFACATAQSDEFDTPATLADWAPTGDRAATSFEITGGDLIGTQLTVASWYEDDESTLRYKPIDGDFLFETDVMVTGAVGNYQNAGLIARSTTTVDSWVEVSIGRTVGRSGTIFKSASAGDSVPMTNPTGTMAGRLRLCRIGDHFYGFRNIGSGWEAIGDIARPDLTGEIQAGLAVNAYSIPNPPSVVGTFHYARFCEIADMNDCSQ